MPKIQTQLPIKKIYEKNIKSLRPGARRDAEVQSLSPGAAAGLYHQQKLIINRNPLVDILLR
jgi:hypothetical protein